jgi:lipoprotein-anchoring transpeptidase ErfK/SrfK
MILNVFQRFIPAFPALVLVLALFAGPARADSGWFTSTHTKQVQYPKGPVSRNYSSDDRVRYQLWPYSWHPLPDEPIDHITINIAKQMVYVYQGDHLAASSPVTTGKPGHETPTGHFSIIKKDINHKSNLYGYTVDAHGNVVDDNANAGEKSLPAGVVYDSADMPYYMRLRDDGTGMHGGYLPGYPASHGCIRLPHAFAELLYSNVSLGVPVDIVQE